jgi:hypothetical protein
VTGDIDAAGEAEVEWEEAGVGGEPGGDGYVSPDDCRDGGPRTGDGEVFDGIDEDFGGDEEGGGCETGPKEGIAVPIELVLGLGCANGPDAGAGSR